jgi:hypothetical protein
LHGRQEATAAAGGEATSHSLGPEGGEHIFHFSQEIALPPEGGRAIKGAAVIGHEPEAVERMGGPIGEPRQALLHHGLQKVDDLKIQGNGPPEAPLQGAPQVPFLLQGAVDVAQMVETAGTHDQQRFARVGQAEVPGRELEAQLRVHHIGRGGAAAVPIRQFRETETQNFAGFHKGLVALPSGGGHGAAWIKRKLEERLGIHDLATFQ